ncbi:hypothetical protein, partial [Paraburkholderia ribeironis]|uniref:hypothetical protein n=1 Tax=Paraburkholderia ribeironis TaxID=1247936 RepID=UPI000A74DF8A
MANDNTGQGGGPASSDPSKLVADNIDLLFAKVTAPESSVDFSVPSRPSLGDINGTVDQSGNTVPGSVDTFELRTGPTDVDSYHDFYRLQMAFEDVWQELTSDQGVYQRWNALMDAMLGPQRIKDRSKEFMVVDEKGNVKLTDGTAVTTAGGTPLNINDISGAEDLANFVDFLKQQFGLETGNIPPAYSQLATIVQRLVNTCADLFNQVNRAGSWSKDMHAGQMNDGNWPDDRVGTEGGVTSNPFTVVKDNTPSKTRYDFLNGILSDINGLIGSLQNAPDNTTLNIQKLLSSFDQILKERYVFDVFAPNSVNYALLINYRQHWTPISYQVGNLVSTIPLAPQEVRKYTTRTVIQKKRNVREIDDSLRVAKDDSSDATRLDGEIVSRAKNSSNFQQNASGSFGNDAIYKVSAGIQQGQDQSIESAQTKRDFHEAVSKSAQELRNEHRTEVTTDESREEESTSYREIRNPNDELTVTYLFYELQRRYKVSETLNKITPVILVANDVPSPHEVDESWLIRHDWIIKRTILDDSFAPALEYLSTNYTGVEIQLEVYKLEVEHQRSVVDRISQQVSMANQDLDTATLGLQTAENQDVADMQRQETMNMVKSFFDPLGLTKSGVDGNSDRARVDFEVDPV